MKYRQTLIMCYLVMFFHVLVSYGASTQPGNWFSRDRTTGVTINVDFFMTSSCPYCHKAEEFFRELSIKKPWIKVNRYVINENRSQLQFFYKKLYGFHSTDFSVPSIMFCDSRWVGFQSAETTGKGLLHALEYCRQQIEKQDKLTEVTRNTLRQWSATTNSNIKVDFTVPSSHLGRVVFTAWIEAVTPCSLFCLLIFLSFLWLYPENRSVQFYVGLAFILILGLLHMGQYVYTAGYQKWMLSYSPWFSKISGVVLLLYVILYVQSRWLSGLRRLVAWTLFVLGFSMIAIYNQQLCGFNSGTLFQQYLITQTLTTSAFYFYQLTYLMFYLMPLVLLWCIYLVFGVHPRKILPVSACLMLAFMGILLLVYPTGLSSLELSVMVLILSILISWLYVKHTSIPRLK